MNTVSVIFTYKNVTFFPFLDAFCSYVNILKVIYYFIKIKICISFVNLNYLTYGSNNLAADCRFLIVYSWRSCASWGTAIEMNGDANG